MINTTAIKVLLATYIFRILPPERWHRAHKISFNFYTQRIYFQILVKFLCYSFKTHSIFSQSSLELFTDCSQPGVYKKISHSIPQPPEGFLGPIDTIFSLFLDFPKNVAAVSFISNDHTQLQQPMGWLVPALFHLLPRSPECWFERWGGWKQVVVGITRMGVFVCDGSRSPESCHRGSDGREQKLFRPSYQG